MIVTKLSLIDVVGAFGVSGTYDAKTETGSEKGLKPTELRARTLNA